MTGRIARFPGKSRVLAEAGEESQTLTGILSIDQAIKPMKRKAFKRQGTISERSGGGRSRISLT